MRLISRLIFILVTVFAINITVCAYTAYKVGDEVTYNNVDYYVIADSDANETSVTMLKAEPLSHDEVQTYSEGTGARIYNLNMQYSKDNNNYLTSYVKTTVDAWANDKVQAGLVEARLLSSHDLSNYLGYSWRNTGTIYSSSNGETPTWVYNVNCCYWTMAEYSDSLDGVWAIASDGHIDPNQKIGYSYNCVRPVVTLKKTALGDDDESIKDDSDSQDIVDSDGTDSDSLEDKVLAKEEKKSSVENNEVSVKVGNTYMRQTLIIMIIGFISICSGVVIFYIIKNKKIISRR